MKLTDLLGVAGACLGLIVVWCVCDILIGSSMLKSEIFDTLTVLFIMGQQLMVPVIIAMLNQWNQRLITSQVQMLAAKLL